jgi:hypothetical protein
MSQVLNELYCLVFLLGSHFQGDGANPWTGNEYMQSEKGKSLVSNSFGAYQRQQHSRTSSVPNLRDDLINTTANGRGSRQKGSV